MKRAKNKSEKATDFNKPKTGPIQGRCEFLETVLESLTHPFYVIDANDYTIQVANSAARSGDMPAGTTCYALTHRKNKPCGMKDHPCPLEMVKKTRKPVTVEHIHYDKDGNTRSVEVHGFPIFDDNGNIVQMIEYCLDITDRKRTEEALRQSEQRYRSFVQNFQGIVYQGHMNFVPVFFHGAVEKITGYKESDFVAGRPRWDQVIHPEDFVKISRLAENIRTVPGYTTEREYRIIRKDKKVRWVHEMIQNVCDDSGKPIFVQGVLYDITERKQMEEDLRQHRGHLEELVQARTTEITEANKQLLNEIERRKLLEEELLSIAERERQRIGQGLHDSIGQQLTGITFMMEVIGEKLAAESLIEERQYAEKIKSRLSQAAEQTHNLAKGLYAIDLDRNGLVLEMQELASNTEELFDISCSFKCDNAVSINDVSAATNLYRITQEAITNAIKHGHAKNVRIALFTDHDGLKLTIENDGLDFTAGANCEEGMGLRIMRYRAEVMNGSLDVRTGDNGGTIVTCNLKKEYL